MQAADNADDECAIEDYNTHHQPYPYHHHHHHHQQQQHQHQQQHQQQQQQKCLSSLQHYEQKHSNATTLLCIVLGLRDANDSDKIQEGSDFRFPPYSRARTNVYDMLPMTKHLKDEVDRRFVLLQMDGDIPTRNMDREEAINWLLKYPIPEHEQQFFREELDEFKRKVESRVESQAALALAPAASVARAVLPQNGNKQQGHSRQHPLMKLTRGRRHDDSSDGAGNNEVDDDQMLSSWEYYQKKNRRKDVLMTIMLGVPGCDFRRAPFRERPRLYQLAAEIRRRSKLIPQYLQKTNEMIEWLLAHPIRDDDDDRLLREVDLYKQSLLQENEGKQQKQPHRGSRQQDKLPPGEEKEEHGQVGVAQERATAVQPGDQAVRGRAAAVEGSAERAVLAQQRAVGVQATAPVAAAAPATAAAAAQPSPPPVAEPHVQEYLFLQYMIEYLAPTLRRATEDFIACSDRDMDRQTVVIHDRIREIGSLKRRKLELSNQHGLGRG